MRFILIVCAMIVAGNVLADSAVLGTIGINSEVTGLNGAGILIGQAEIGRSGKPEHDDAGHSATGTVPTGVYFRFSAGMDSANSSNVTNHATGVAGLMIGQNEPHEGVAPGAVLHSAALGGNADDVDIALTLNRLATLSAGAVRAINIATARPLQSPPEELGDTHWTNFIDWSARVHDVLYVVAWGDEGLIDEPRTPADNYTASPSVRLRSCPAKKSGECLPL